MRFKLAIFVLFSLVLTSCDLGFNIEDEAESETNTVFRGPSENESWQLTLNAVALSFTLRKRATPTGSVSFTLEGTFERLDNGFLDLTITSSLPTNVTSTQIEAIELEDNAVILFPFETGDAEFIALVPEGECPTLDISANRIGFDDRHSDATSIDAGFVGQFTYSVNDEEVRLSSGLALDDGFTVQNSTSITSGTCTDGIAGADPDDHYLNTLASVIERSDTGGYSRLLSIPVRAITSLSNLNGDYVGFVRKYSAPDDTQLISANCLDGTCNIRGENSINSLLQTNDQYQLVFDEDLIDMPVNGIIEGEIFRTGNVDPGNLACIANIDLKPANSDETKVLACVGQSPEDNTSIVNVIMVSKGN